MPVEVIGIDHIYIAVRDMAVSEEFYDRVMTVLGFRKIKEVMEGEPHVHYVNRHYGFSIRPARPGTTDHDRFAPGLHHFCFRVTSVEDVEHAAREIAGCGVEVTEPALYPQYASDYYATFFSDPDGVRLEITNFRQQRRVRRLEWENDAR